MCVFAWGVGVMLSKLLWIRGVEYWLCRLECMAERGVPSLVSGGGGVAEPAEKIEFVIRFAIVQSLAHNAASSAKHSAKGATGFSARFMRHPRVRGLAARSIRGSTLPAYVASGNSFTILFTLAFALGLGFFSINKA
jgi:hypothetical protein